MHLRLISVYDLINAFSEYNKNKTLKINTLKS